MTDSEPVLLQFEPDPESRFHCEALASHFPGARVTSLPEGDDLPDPENVSAAVLSGSTAGVYEDRDWIAAGREFVRALVTGGVPTLGICFGHQLVHDALGGRVEPDEFRAGLVTALYDRDPLFADLSRTVPVAHGDMVREAGDGLVPIASVREYDYPLFATRHRERPVWTVQFHPEFGPSHREQLEATFDWQPNGHRFADVTGARLFGNFRDLAGWD